MTVAVSACLLGENCKYNGKNNFSETLSVLLEGHRVIPICPEVLGGLPVPRAPAEIVNGIVTDAQGHSVDGEFRLGAEKALTSVLAGAAELVILQPRSPSCGVGSVYDGTFSGRLISGNGIFASLLLEKGIPVYEAGDERLPALLGRRCL